MATIQPGLERITALLKDATFPWKSIHVAGTNGKGSVCHYASSMLVGRSVKVGKFTSPHLVDRWDCITINGKPIEESKFRTVERHLLRVNKTLRIGASPFEILTAAAFTCFHDAKVKVGVVEVGMGGRLDSTNILNNQTVSVITKIAQDHQGFLGSTLAEIAGHKAGILRPDVPYIVNPANEANVKAVIDDYAQSIGAGPRLFSNSWELDSRLYSSSKWSRVSTKLLPFQRENLKLAVVAVMQTLDTLQQGIKPTELAKTLLLNTSHHHPGRQELVCATPVFKEATQRKNQVLVDGAHNPDAGAALDDFVNKTQRLGQSPAAERPESGWPVTWVLAMTEGKDARQYLATILKPGDRVVTTTFGPVDGMPWVKPMDPKELLEVAKSVQPDITGVHVPVIGALRALCTAKYMSNQMAPWAPIALTGSLYLVGDLHRELRPRAAKTWWTDPSHAAQADREAFLEIQAEERKRADAVWKLKQASAPSKPDDSASSEQAKLQDELEALGRKVQGLEIEEQRLVQDHSLTLDVTGGEPALSAGQRLEFEDRRFAELHATPEQMAASLARAEKAKEALVRHQAKMEILTKAREEKREKRLANKQRLADRRERKSEKRNLVKVHKERRMAALGLNEKDVPKWLHEKQKRDIAKGLESGRISRELDLSDQLSKDSPPSKGSGLSTSEQPKDSDRLSTSDQPEDSDQPSKHTPSLTTTNNKAHSFPKARSNTGTKPRRPAVHSPEDELLALSSSGDNKSNRDNKFNSDSKPSQFNRDNTFNRDNKPNRNFQSNRDNTSNDYQPDRSHKNTFFGKSDSNPSRTAPTNRAKHTDTQDLRSVIPPMRTESREPRGSDTLSPSDESRRVAPRQGSIARRVGTAGRVDQWMEYLAPK